MSEPNVPKPPVVERMAESVWAKILARYVAPLGLLIIGWLAVEVRSDVKAISEQLGTITGDVREHKARLDAHDFQIRTHENRLNWLGQRSFGSRDPPEAPAP